MSVFIVYLLIIIIMGILPNFVWTRGFQQKACSAVCLKQ